LSLNPVVSVKELVARFGSEHVKVLLELVEALRCVRHIHLWRLLSLFVFCLEELGEEAFADLPSNRGFLARVQTGFQHYQVGNRQEYLCVAAIKLLLKLGILVGSALDQLAEADQLLSVGLRNQMGLAQTPGLLKPSYQVHELWIISKLRVHHFHVLGVSVDEKRL